MKKKWLKNPSTLAVIGKKALQKMGIRLLNNETLKKER